MESAREEEGKRRRGRVKRSGEYKGREREEKERTGEKERRVQGKRKGREGEDG